MRYDAEARAVVGAIRADAERIKVDIDRFDIRSAPPAGWDGNHRYRRWGHDGDIACGCGHEPHHRPAPCPITHKRSESNNR